MVNFVQKYKIYMLNPSIGYNKDTVYKIEVIATTDEIALLVKNDDNIQIFEEVGLHNYYSPKRPQQSLPAADFSSACSGINSNILILSK
jgi:hypothetical protein